MAKSKRLTDEQRLLVEDNVALVGYVLNKFGNYGLGNSEDAFQIGLLGLMKAAARFDIARGVKFSSFAVPCIINELKRERQSQCRARRNYGVQSYSLDEPMLIDGEFFSRVENQPNLEADLDERVAQAEVLRCALRPLLRQHTLAAKITLEYLLSGNTQVELAERYGLSQSCVSRYILENTRRLRRQIRKMGGVSS